ncbi:MFS transporter [Streptomyces sp. RS10V-4]|uniref:MFS transporter n=1 Tax=Streptomyces rhizoryzae TaxID=2932493 RepID=UPI002003938C|nr:MFS transporter [Streptomyces rhizoryzae]MCK7623767.1 MFS transporter [Streptomyces rhizoryzae]
MLARLPVYLMSLAMVLLVREQGGSYAQSGTVAAAYTVCMAVGGPLIARRADRSGPRAVLLVTGLVHPAALAVLVWATAPGSWAQPAVAGVAGLALPPANSVMRSLWARLPLADGERELAYLWEALLTEVLVITAPLLLAGLMLAGSAGLALTAAAAAGGAGALGLACTRAAGGGRRPAADRAADGRASVVLGPLRNPALLALTAIMATCALPIGLMTLAIPAFVDAHGARGGTGVVYACWGVGSAAGALWLGRGQAGVAVYRRFPRQVLGYALGTALPLLATSEVALGLALAVGGAPIALVSASEMTLVGAVSEERQLTEAFTWASLATVAGDALGQQAGGLLMAPLGPRGVFAAAFAVALAGAGLAFACRGLLTRGVRPATVSAEAVA